MNIRAFQFWHRWLLAISILQIFVGLLVALAPDSALFAARRNTRWHLHSPRNPAKIP